MKRFLVWVFLFTPLYVFAANKMSMVTYFPVPYVAYSRVSVSEQLDAGLTNDSNMILGSDSSKVNLQVNTLNVKGEKLDLNGGKGVLSKDMVLGSGAGNGHIEFNNVRIEGGTSRSINVQNTMNVPKLTLFESEFPDCKSVGGANGQMSWTPLTLKGATQEELYLACGTPGPGTCQPTDSRGARYTVNECPSGQSGSVTYTWNESTCKYDKTNNCYTPRTCEWVSAGSASLTVEYTPGYAVLEGTMSCLGCRGVVSCMGSTPTNQDYYAYPACSSDLSEFLMNNLKYDNKNGDTCYSQEAGRGQFRALEKLSLKRTTGDSASGKIKVSIPLYKCECNY